MDEQKLSPYFLRRLRRKLVRTVRRLRKKYNSINSDTHVVIMKCKKKKRKRILRSDSIFDYPISRLKTVTNEAFWQMFMENNQTLCSSRSPSVATEMQEYGYLDGYGSYQEYALYLLGR